MSSPTSAASASRRPSRHRPERHPSGAGRRPSPPFSRFRPFPLARFGLAAVCAFAAAFALLLGAGAAEAQTSVKLVSNTGQTNATDLDFNRDHAQAFNTGPHATGYKLTRVDLELRHTGGAQPTYTVSIHADSSGSPGASLGTLTNPSSLPSSWGLVQFTAPGGVVDLAASTTYWVVIDVSSGNTSTRQRRTSSNAEDPGRASGWGIADTGRFRTNSSTGSWSTSDTARKIAVHGYETPVPEFSSATVSDSVVTVTFSGAFSGCPALRAWTVKVEGVRYPASSGRCASPSVKLWLSGHQTPEVYRGETVTLSYDKTRADRTHGTVVLGTKLSAGDTDLDSFSDEPVTNLSRHGAPAIHPAWLASRSWFSGATVNGKVLTLTFRKAPDENSVPAVSAFRVSTYHGGGPGLRRCRGFCRVAVTDVSVSGTTATLTLDEAIPSHGDTSVSYGPPPATNPLRDPGGGRKWGRLSAPVTVLTPDTAPVFSSARLSHDTQEQASWLVIEFNEWMDEGSVPAGSAFRVTARPRGGGARTVEGTGTVSLNASLMSVKLARQVAPGEKVTVSYVKPPANPLRDRAGNALESFSGMSANNGKPRVESVAIVSDAGPDRTYGRGEKVRVRVTFNGPVKVATRGGRPRLKLSLVRSPYWWRYDEQRWAAYEGGSGTDTLTFAYTVARSDASTAGIGVPANAVDLNGGRIVSWWVWPEPADLAHAGRAHDAGHKVDGSLPRFKSAAVDGTALTLTFDETLDTGSVPAPGAFYVTVDSARRNVASGGVAISGATVKLTLASAVSHGETVKLRYTKPSANPLRSASGHAVETFADRAVTNNTPIWSATLTAKLTIPGSGAFGCWEGFVNCGPVLTDNTFTWAGISYQFKTIVKQEHPLGSSLKPHLWIELNRAIPRALTLHVGNSQFPVADATLSQSDRRARWNYPGFSWLHNQQVQLRLTAGGSGSSGGDTTAPTFSSAAADGTALTVSFNETLDEDSVPAPGDFHVTVGSARRNVAAGGVAISGKTVTLTLASAVTSTDTVKVRYTKPSTNPLQDAAGNDVETFADQAVTNNTVADTTAPSPKFAAATVSGTHFTVAIDFGEALDPALEVAENTPSSTAFTVNVAGTDRTPSTVGVVAPERTVALIFLTNPVVTAGQAVKVSYDPSQAGGDNKKLRDPAGNEVVSFTEFAVTNAAGDTAAPTFASAAVDGTALTVTFNELLNWGVSPAGSAFTVSATPSGGSARTIAGTGTVAISGKTATVTLASAVAAGETVTVAYTKPASGDVVEDAAGNDLATFTGQSVTNNTGGGAVGDSGGPASVTGVSVVSGAGPDKTYGIGDTIHVRVTFDSPVDVTGTPRLKIDMDPAHWGEKWAAYASGSGTSSLTFAHTVVEPN